MGPGLAVICLSLTPVRGCFASGDGELRSAIAVCIRACPFEHALDGHGDGRRRMNARLSLVVVSVFGRQSSDVGCRRSGGSEVNTFCHLTSAKQKARDRFLLRRFALVLASAETSKKIGTSSG